MAGIKSLAKDTAIYGLSSIVGRLLNWCLVPMYTNVLPKGEYGIVTNLYAYTALLLVFLTCGMETGFFRFASHERWKDPIKVYSTTLVPIGVTSMLFIVLASVFATPIAGMLKCEDTSFIQMLAIIVGVDAFCSIPFAYLRYKKRPLRFAFLKVVPIGLNIGLNLFFILLCPYLWRVAPEWIMWFYDPDFGIGYIFISNMISSLATIVMLYPEIIVARLEFCGRLFKEMFRYSFPLLVLGLAGIMNQNLGQMMYPFLDSSKEAMSELGIYGANYKIAIIMVMFLQAFRFAYDPFIFAQHKKDDKEGGFQVYRDAMKYFFIFGLLIFLGVMFYLDVLKYFIGKEYFSGLKVVPIIMIAELFFGVFFNLSIWYKLTDKTIWGVWFSLLGLIITVAINVAFVPRFGYIACAWAAFACYGVMMVASYLVGKKKYPIGYDIPRMMQYFVIAMVLYVVGIYLIDFSNSILNMALRTVLIAGYCAIVLKIEKVNPLAILKRG